MARRRGVIINLKKVYRLSCEKGLKVRRRGGRKRAIGARVPLEKAARPNAIWVLDFVLDTLESVGYDAITERVRNAFCGITTAESYPGWRWGRAVYGAAATPRRPGLQG